MEARTILLLSAAFFCLFHHARAIPYNEERFESSNQLEETATATPLHRYTRDIVDNLISVVEQVVSGTIQLPEDFVQSIVRVIRAMYARVQSSIQSAMETVRSAMDRFASDVSETTNYLLERKRRAVLDLLETVPSMMLHPLDFLQRSADTARNYASEQIETMSERAMSVALNFAASVLLPWLHKAIEQLEKTNDLPSTLRNMLQDFDYAYSLLQTLG